MSIVLMETIALSYVCVFKKSRALTDDVGSKLKRIRKKIDDIIQTDLKEGS